MEPSQDLVALMPYAVGLGIHLDQASADHVVGSMPWRADLCTAGGILHGGALMSLADSVGALCAFLNLPTGANTSTIESKTNFLRGVRQGKATASARPVHVGGSTIVVQTEIRDDQERLVALVTQTQVVLKSQ